MLQPIAICGKTALSARLDAMKAFGLGGGSVLVSTQVVLEDISDLAVPSFDLVISFDIPRNLVKYNTRFRALAIVGIEERLNSMVSLYDIELSD